MSPKLKCKSDLISGVARNNLPKNHLPSELDIIRYFRFQHENQHFSIGKSIQIVATETVEIWNQAGLPHQLKRNVVRRVAKLVGTWQRLKKAFKKKLSVPAVRACKMRMNCFFNIGVDHIEQNLQGDTVRSKFWSHQLRSKGPVAFPKNVFSSVTQRMPTDNGKKRNTVRKKVTRLRRVSLEQTVSRRSKRLEVLSNAVIENLDRSRVSDRAAVGVLAATAAAFGVGPESLSLSRSTLSRKRKVVRQEIASRIHANFPKHKAVVVHFDSKQLLFNRKKTEKLAIVVTGDSIEQIINCSFLDSGTGKSVAEEVFKSLLNWNLDGIISAKCYDTTHVNSGERNGAAVLLERMIGRKMLDFPCRHHVFELVLMTAYKTCFVQATTSPDETLFKLFRNDWDRLDKEDYSGFPNDLLAEAEQQEIIVFCRRMLLKEYVREDYRELLELVLACVGDNHQVTFRRPGALHHARWMAKAIYGLKMYLFREQFEVDVEKLQRFVLFVTLIYIKGWYEAPVAIKAPLNDLNFMKQLKSYKDVELSEKTSKKFENHLWYLSELNISLAFFDDNVDAEMKRKMVENLSKKSDRKMVTRVKKFSARNGLEDYVTENSKQFFEILRLDSRFLFEEDPSKWNDREDYVAAKIRCGNLCVINDAAERALGAASDFNSFGPKTDDEKRQLLLAVAENRKLQNNSLKSSVFDYVQA